MPSYQECDADVADMAQEILAKFETHEETIRARVKIDFLFAYADEGEDGEPLGPAIKHHGCKALGLCRVVNARDRAKGNGDVEILLDGNWWREASGDEQEALLDHELHHIMPVIKEGAVQVDGQGRPKVKMRPHDHEFGWFKCIAARHKLDSQERIQARQMMEQAGQYYWPEMIGGEAAANHDGPSPALKKAVERFKKIIPNGGSVTISSGGVVATMDGK